MINLKATDREYGDATRDYIVEFDKEYTIKEFVEEILEEHSKDWGYFRIPLEYYSVLAIEYEKGKITKNLEILEQYFDKKIEKVSANGGWSRMDYFIVFK